MGFKVYAKADSTLLYGSNKLNFTLPNEVATQEIFIVAAQADGTDVEIKTVAEGGDETQQYAALKTSISEAKKVIAMSDESGKKPGYYFASVVETLEILLIDAQEAYDNKDQSTHTYGEWAALITAEMRRIATLTDTKQVIYAANWYSLTNAQYTSYSVANSGTKLRCTIAAPEQNESKQWAFEPAGEPNTYYLLNKETGKYISSIGMSAQVTATATTTNAAIPFVVTDNGDGTFTINDPEQGYGALHCDAGKSVVGWATDANASHWTLTCIVDGQKDIFEAQLIELITRAEEILTELIADYNVGMEGERMTLCTDVTPLVGVDTLLTWAEALQGYVFLHNYANCRLVDCVDNVQGVINTITTLINNLSMGYRKTVYLPEASTKEHPILYTLRDISTGEYVTYDQVSSRYKGYISTVAQGYLDTNASESRPYLWYFEKGNTEDSYHIVNYETLIPASTVSGKQYISVFEGEPLDIKITIDEEQGGLIFTNPDEKTWNCNSSHYVVTSKIASTVWKLTKIGVLNAIELPTTTATGIYYDLQGRQVASPTRGIYIRDGQKVIVK